LFIIIIVFSRKPAFLLNSFYFHKNVAYAEISDISIKNKKKKKGRLKGGEEY